MSPHFRDLQDFEERHTHDELEACAAALFLAHHDTAHYEHLSRDIEQSR